MTVWLGLLDPNLEAAVTYDQPEAEHSFPLTNGVLALPYARALLAAANDHFTFVTAESGGAGPPVNKTEARFAALEAQMSELINLVKKSPAQEAPPPSPVPRKSALKTPSKRRGADGGYPTGLDPVVVQQALQAGIAPESIDEIGNLMLKPGKATYKQGPPPPNPVEDSEDEEELEALANPAAMAGDPMSMAVMQMSKILSSMHREKSRARDRTLEGLLDQAESGSGSQSSSSLTRTRAAALRSLQKALSDQPKLIYQEVERLMQADWERSGQLPGLTAGGVTARGWLEHRSRIQMFPSTIRMAWMIAGVLDALRSSRPEEARARCCLALASLDQQAADRGSWALAAEVTLEQPPPFHSFQLHRAPEGWESPHSQLVDPRWAELFMSRLKDVSDYQERRSKLANSSQNTARAAAEENGKKAEAKKGAKGAGKSKADAKQKDAEPRPSGEATA